MPTPTTLTETETAILDFSKLWWQYNGAKEQAIRDRFDMWPETYYQALGRLIDREDALAHDPNHVRRLRERRSARQRSRGARSLGIVDSVGAGT